MCDNIADVDADTEGDTVIQFDIVVSLRHAFLHSDGTTNGVYCTWELQQQTVTGSVGDAPITVGLR